MSKPARYVDDEVAALIKEHIKLLSSDLTEARIAEAKEGATPETRARSIPIAMTLRELAGALRMLDRRACR